MIGPIDMRCPRCGAAPGRSCVTRDRAGQERGEVWWFHKGREEVAALPTDDPRAVRASASTPQRRLTLPSLPKTYAHGTHASYVNGCRCADCRAGHCAYVKARYRAIALGGDAARNGLVPADRARRHLLLLSRAGVGRRSVHDASGVSASVLQGIRNGSRTRCRASIERRILAIDRTAFPGGAVRPAKRTRKLIARLIDDGGFSKAEIARRLGYRTPALQIGVHDRITAANAHAIEKLYRSVS